MKSTPLIVSHKSPANSNGNGLVTLPGKMRQAVSSRDILISVKVRKVAHPTLEASRYCSSSFSFLSTETLTNLWFNFQVTVFQKDQVISTCKAYTDPHYRMLKAHGR